MSTYNTAKKVMTTTKKVATYTAMGVGLLGVCAMQLAFHPFRKKDKWEIGGHVVKRPKHFKSRAHKKAFEDVGRYVTNGLTRNVMESYTDSSLAQESWLRPSKVPKQVWDEVLDFYRDEGVIEERWRLQLPRNLESGYEYRSTPCWNAEGTYLKDLESPSGRDTIMYGLIEEEGMYNPTLLSAEQKDALMGTEYALSPKGGYRDDGATVTVTEDEFTRVFYRDADKLSQKTKDAAAKTLVDLVKISRH